MIEAVKEWFTDHLFGYHFRKMRKHMDWVNKASGEHNKTGIHQYVETATDQKWFKLVEIVVETEDDKQQLLLASKYFHDLWDVDTNLIPVNYLCHLYQSPELVRVKQCEL